MRVAQFLASIPLLLIASSASAVTMAWTPIGNPGNAPDSQVMTTMGRIHDCR